METIGDFGTHKLDKHTPNPLPAVRQMSSLDNSDDFLEKMLGLKEAGERELFDLLSETSGFIGGSVAQAWIDWDKGVKQAPFAEGETIMELWIPPWPHAADEEEEIRENVAETLADMGFHPVRDVENLYRSRKKNRMEIFVNYEYPPVGALIVYPIAGSGYEYAFGGFEPPVGTA